jgi:hypothetical protein
MALFSHEFDYENIGRVEMIYVSANETCRYLALDSHPGAIDRVGIHFYWSESEVWCGESLSVPGTGLFRIRVAGTHPE